MEHSVFRAWLAAVDDLTTAQRLELEELLAGRPPRAAATAVIEASLGDERRCPHCGNEKSVGCGKANGLRRFRCKQCGKSFNALTGTPLARLRKKERSSLSIVKAALAPRLDGLRSRYGEPWRHHHVLDHIEDGIAAIERLVTAFNDPGAAYLANWYHDAVYMPWASSNEVASAALLRHEMSGRVPAATLDRAEAIVLASIDHRVPAGIDPDTAQDIALYLDIDIAVLGAQKNRYDRFESGIAAEYLPFYDNEKYHVGRIEVLTKFLDREKIYNSPHFAHLEATARDNLNRAIRTL